MKKEKGGNEAWQRLSRLRCKPRMNVDTVMNRVRIAGEAVQQAKQDVKHCPYLITNRLTT